MLQGITEPLSSPVSVTGRSAPRLVVHCCGVQTDAMPERAKAAGTPLAGLRAACAEQCASQLSAIRIRSWSTAELGNFNFENLEPQPTLPSLPTRQSFFLPTQRESLPPRPLLFCNLPAGAFSFLIPASVATAPLIFTSSPTRSRLHSDPLLIPRDNRISCLPSNPYLQSQNQVDLRNDICELAFCFLLSAFPRHINPLC